MKNTIKYLILILIYLVCGVELQAQNYTFRNVVMSDGLSGLLVNTIYKDSEGEFEKDDIVRIIDFQGNQVGVGKANCDSQQAKEVIGKHGKKPVVHYDYLYIE